MAAKPRAAILTDGSTRSVGTSKAIGITNVAMAANISSMILVCDGPAAAVVARATVRAFARACRCSSSIVRPLCFALYCFICSLSRPRIRGQLKNIGPSSICAQAPDCQLDCSMVHIEGSRSVRLVLLQVTELVQGRYGRPRPARSAVLFRTIELSTNLSLSACQQ